MADAANTPSGVTDSGASFGGGGGAFDFEGLGNMINSGIETFHRETLNKQELRGNDPCLYWAAQEELYYGVIKDAVEKANGVAAKTSALLQMALHQSYKSRGYPSSKYVGGKDLGTFLGEELGLDALVPEGMLAGFGIAIGLSGGAAAPFAAGALSEYIKDHLPSWADIRDGRIPINGKGVQMGNSGVFLWGEGLPANPSSSSQKRQIYESSQAKYRGRPIADAIALWVEYQRDNVAPPDYSSARRKLIDYVGTWEGSGDYDLWQPGDPITSTSKVGEINFVKADLFRGIDEAKGLCNSIRQQGIDYQIGLGEAEERRKLIGLIGALAVAFIAARRL